MLGNVGSNFERNIRVERRALQYVDPTALQQQRNMLVGVGTTICTGRRMQVGRVLAAYVSTTHLDLGTT